MTTTTAVRRAVQEAIDGNEEHFTLFEAEAMSTLLRSPKLLTLLANSLSDRGDAGNAARDEHLENLAALNVVVMKLTGSDGFRALEWAIDQLTPPEPYTQDAGPKAPPPWWRTPVPGPDLSRQQVWHAILRQNGKQRTWEYATKREAEIDASFCHVASEVSGPHPAATTEPLEVGKCRPIGPVEPWKPQP